MGRKLLILFVWSLWCFPSLSIDFMINFTTPESCTTNQYFQFSSLRCVPCNISGGQERSSDGFSCTCQKSYKMVKNKGGHSITCKACNNADGSRNFTSSLDGSFCIECPTDLGFNAKTGTCNSCLADSVATDRSRNGARLSTRKCERCVEDTTPGGEDLQACRRCHSSFFLPGNDSLCSSCTENGFVISGGVCFRETILLQDTSSMYKVEYGDKSIYSAFFRTNLRASQALCKKDSNFTACQLLGNLCVLLHYIQSGSACDEYKKIKSDSNR